MDQNYPLVHPVLDLTIEPIIPSVQPSNVEAAVHVDLSLLFAAQLANL